MIKERRYKLYLMNNKTYEIDEADLKKLTENAHEMLVTLKQVMVHPASISAIEPFYVPYTQKMKELGNGGVDVSCGGSGGYARQSTMIPDGEPVPPKPIINLFSERLLELENGKN